jgi:hypothetical protein
MMLACGEEKKAELCTPRAVLRITEGKVGRAGDGTKPPRERGMVVGITGIACYNRGSSLTPLVNKYWDHGVNSSP